jgi:hypothetical protein
MVGLPDEDPARTGLAQAREALRSGETDRARELLEGRIDAAPDPEALRLLGELLHDQGDLPRAGAIWFGAAVKGPEVDAAIEAWRASLDGDFGRMWRSLPKSVRRQPGSARVEALRSRALGQASARTAPHPVDAAPAAADLTSHPDVPADPDAVAADPEDAAKDANQGGAAEPGAQDVSAEDDPHAEPASANANSEGPLARARAALDSARSIGATVTEVDEDDDSDGFDAAQVIAWALAAFFVVCAVVGLITILQWIVPG